MGARCGVGTKPRLCRVPDRFVLAGTHDALRPRYAPSLTHGPPLSGVQDKKVIIWTQDTASAGAWNQKEIQFACVVWRVSWSVTGNILAVSGGDNQVTLWKESLLGEWTQIGQLSEDGSAAKS